MDKVCGFQDCFYPTRRPGYCSGHLEQRRLGREMKPLQVRSKTNQPDCLFEGCDKPKRGRGYCSGHYYQLNASKKLTPLFVPQYEWGEWFLTTKGYTVRKRTNPDTKKIEQQWQHRLVMEEKLGRPLRGIENVHHINGVRTDNQPENLELWVIKQPPGQRPEELVTWANEILEMYGT